MNDCKVGVHGMVKLSGGRPCRSHPAAVLHPYGRMCFMEKKIPALVVLAAITTEAILVERHHDGVQPPHIETDVKTPSETITTANASGASGAGRAVSATGVLTSNDDSDRIQPHIEPSGPVPTTGSTLTQTS